MNESTLNAKVDGQERLDASIEHTTMLVPIGLTSQFNKTMTDYRTLRRKDPRYVEALYDAVVLDETLRMFANEGEEIDEATWTAYFANLDELVAIFKDEVSLPKALIARLLQGYADVVTICPDYVIPELDDYRTFVEFRYEYQERLCELLGCNHDQLVTRLE